MTDSCNNCNKPVKIATQVRKRGSPCGVCIHPRRAEFDRALALGTMTPAAVAREVGCHRSTVTRHLRNHLLPAAVFQVNTDPELAEVDILAEMKTLYRRMRDFLERAEKTDNWRVIKAFHAESRRDLELLAELMKELDRRPQVNIHQDPEWIELRTVILLALEPYPEARLALAARLKEVDGAGR